MLRKLWIIAAVGVMLAVLGGLEQRMVKRLTEEGLRQTTAIFEAIRQDDLPGAQGLADRLDHSWDEEAEKLEILMDHGSTDEVRFALSRLLAALEGRNRAAALIYAGELEGSIEHVRERQEVTLQNLL